jgi:hypothetical protein
VRGKPSGFKAAETITLVSTTRRSGITTASCSLHVPQNGPVNLLRSELVRALVFRFFANNPEDLGLRSNKTHVVLDTEQHRAEGAAFLDHQGTPFLLDPPRKLAEVSASVQGGNQDAFAFSCFFGTGRNSKFHCTN